MTESAAPPTHGGSVRRLVSRYLEDARRLKPKRGEVVPQTPAPESIDSGYVKQLVEPHLFYVVQVASEYGGRNVAFEDLLAEGNIGLVEAAHHFNPSLEVKFLTYANWWIRKRILDFLAREGQSVRLTRYAREKRREMRGAHDLLRQRFGREPTPEELAHETGLDLETVLERSHGAPVVLSIDQLSHPDSGEPFPDVLRDARARTPEENTIRRHVRVLVQREIKLLPERERMIIENRFHLDGRDAMTFEEIGALLGLSRERARQIERGALSQLRKRLSRRLRLR